MIYLPDPCCTPVPVVTSCGCDPCTAVPMPTNGIAYSGPNLPCTGIVTGDTATVAFEKVDNEICNLKSQIIALQNIVFGLTTTTTSTSSTSTTTSTTTALCPSCGFYSVTNSTVSPVDVSYLECGGFLVNTSVAGPSTIYVCACEGSVVVPPVPGVTLTSLGDCPTTTTTTTAYPGPFGFNSVFGVSYIAVCGSVDVPLARWATSSPVVLGTFIYQNFAMTTPVADGWYFVPSANTAYEVTGGLGQVTNIQAC